MESRFGSKYLEQIVTRSRECVVVVVCLVVCASSNELNGGQAAAGEHPAPDVVYEQARRQQNVEDEYEAHQAVIFLVDKMVPNADN